MEHKGWTDIILDREGHGNNCRNLRHHQRRCQRGIERNTPVLMPRALPRHSSRLAGRQHDQANIAADKEFAQRLGIDVAVSTLLIAEAQVGLWPHPAQWRLAIHTLALFSIVEFLTIFIRAETTKSAVPI